jgi:chloride channel protein, CIC family
MAQPSAHHLPRLLFRLQRLLRSRDWRSAALAVVSGSIAGLGATSIHRLIDLFNRLFFTVPQATLATGATGLAWWHVVLAPTATAVFIGLMLQFVLKGPPQGLPQIVQACRLPALPSAQPTVRSSARAVGRALAMALLACISIGGGSSLGREGPAVHLGATIAQALCRSRRALAEQRLAMIAAATAGAVAASFNAPLAGIFFAFEVIAAGRLRSSLLVPIVVGAVSGTVLHRLVLGDKPVFGPVAHALTSLLEMPAFLMLGLLCGLAGVALVALIFHIDDGVRRLALPRFVVTGLGGLVVGCIALVVPQVLGVGYQATNTAISGQYTLWLLVAIGIAKTIATAVSAATGSVGGLFAPTLVIGAMIGGAFGVIAGQMLPDFASHNGVYAMAGMGATAAAVLNAPLSTTLIIFEMTGDYPTTLAVLISVGMAMGVYTRLLGADTYTLQLRRRPSPPPPVRHRDTAP